MRVSKVISALLLTGIIAVFIAAFLFLDFRAATSETKIESNVNNASANAPLDSLKVNSSGGLYVYVMEDDDLTQELRHSLTNKLRENGNSILEANSLEKNYDRQILIVALRDRKISYNPFYPSARVKTIFYYSSSGNTTNFKDFKDGKSFVSYFEKSGMVLDGQSELRDTTKGIISLKAYRKYLADEIVKNIIQKLPSQQDIYG